MVKGPNSSWYTMDDERVTQSNIQEVLRQEAYVLFYVRENPPLPPPPRTADSEHVPPKNGISEIKNNQKRKVRNLGNDIRPSESGPLLKKLKLTPFEPDLVEKTELTKNGKLITSSGFQEIISEIPISIAENASEAKAPIKNEKNEFFLTESKNGISKNGKSLMESNNGKSPTEYKNEKSPTESKKCKLSDGI